MINQSLLKNLPLPLMMEISENIFRKDYTQSELAAIQETIRQSIVKTNRPGRPAKEDKVCENGNGKLSNRLDNFGKTDDIIGEFFNESKEIVRQRREVIEAAEFEPEKHGDLVKKMDEENAVKPAYKELKKRRKREGCKKLMEQFEKEIPIDDRWKLFNDDFRNVKLEDESINVIITDPPYPQEYLPLYENLATFSRRALKPGGSLLVMVGQSYLPEIIHTLGKYLKYRWTIAYLTPGPATQIWQRKVNSNWKPVLWFVKGEYQDGWVGDVCQSGNVSKLYHEWEQSKSGMASIVERFTKPGDLILDPFCGTGTTGVAALRLKRRFVGIDNDGETIEIARGRILRMLYDGESS